MGTTRIKVQDLSTNQDQPKAKAKKPVIAEVIEEKTEITEEKPAPKPSVPSVAARKAKTAKTKTRSKRYQEIASQVEMGKIYPLNSALELAKKTAKTKFTGSIDAHLVLKKSFRGNIAFPHPVKTKEEKILIFAPITDKAPANVIFGDEKTIAQILENKLVAGRDFTKVYSTPQYMAQLAKVAKTLGPKGLMPNPKNETIIKSADDALKNLKSGLIEIKTQQDQPIMHQTLGKADASDKILADNFKALVDVIGKDKIVSITLASTMGPGIRVNLST